MRFSLIALLLAALTNATTALADAMVDQPIDGLCAVVDEKEICWNVYPDSVSSSTYYLLPDRYALVHDDRGAADVTSRVTASGDLVIEFGWSAQPLGANELTNLESLLRARSGKHPTILTLPPQLTSIALGPGLSALGVRYESEDDPTTLAPGAPARSRIVIARANKDKVIKQIVDGAGLIADLTLEWNGILFNRTLLILTGARFCELLPDQLCRSVGGGRR